jgi:hypothetical protein
MKFLCAFVLIVTCFSVSAKESYECDFFGPNYFLNIDDNQAITLSNNFSTYQCEKGFVNLPGTELELNTINCTSQHDKVTLYFTKYNDDIILSKNLVFSKDITCKNIK